MKKPISFIAVIIFTISYFNIFGQVIIPIDSIEKQIFLNRESNDYGINFFRTIIKINNTKYILGFGDDNNKSIIDSVNIINLIAPGSQSIFANSYPFKKSSIIFSINKDECLYINKINPFDSTVFVKIKKCPETGVASALITEIPDISITDYFTGNQINIRQYISEHKKNKVVIHFWASSCRPCIKELPLIKELKKRDYLVISFCSSDSDKEKVKEFITKFDLKDPLFIGGNDTIGDEFNQVGFPQLILFDPNEKYPKYFRGIEAILEYETDLKNKTK